MQLLTEKGGGRVSSESEPLKNEAFGVFLHSPIFGIGMDHFRFVSGSGVYPHNNFAVIFAETAIVGAFSSSPRYQGF